MAGHNSSKAVTKLKTGNTYTGVPGFIPDSAKEFYKIKTFLFLSYSTTIKLPCKFDTANGSLEK